MPQEYLRTLFLREFTKDLIKNVKIESSPKIKIVSKKIPEKIKEKVENKLQIPVSAFSPINTSNFAVAPIIRQKNILVSKKSLKTLRKPIPISLTSPTGEYPELGKLNTLVSDVGVEGIECLGPEKNILVKKSGRVQRTNILLTKEDIQKILKDFSEKTRIPLTKGTFKAVLGNLIMTAILSEFVGTKFILQKKTPVSFQEPL